MKNLLRLVLMLAVLPAAVTATPNGLSLGQNIPLARTAMKNIDGRAISIGQAAGPRGTLVLFICNHCPWVQAWQTRIAHIGNVALAESVGVIAINSNDPSAFPEDGFAEMKTRAGEVGYRFPYVVDATSDVARAFGATRTPEAFLFDARGRLVYRGTVDDNARDESAVRERWLEQAVSAVAGGKAVPVAETKAFGCGIKLRPKSST
jgi:hypothetical protein